MNSVHLHRQLGQELEAIGLKASRPQRVNVAYLCQALAFSPNCHLPTLVLQMPLPGQRESLIQRSRRCLKNEHIHPLACYEPLVGHLFAHWPHREVNLVMDRTDLEDRLSVLLLGAAYRKRVLPLAWDIMPFGSSSAQRQIALLDWVQPHLPSLAQVRVTFYGDCEFRAVSVQQACLGYGWHWYVGLKSDVYFHLPGGLWQTLGDLALQPGDRHELPRVYLTQEHLFGPVNLIASWSPNEDSPRYWVLDRPADADAWRRGRKRFWIEPTFRDWKSYGFDLEGSKIDDPGRLDVLLLGMALTTVWMIHVGEWLEHNGRSQEVAPKHRTDYSLFRKGRDYLQRARTLGQLIPVGFTVG